jgi:ribulose-5-phosphate 4-epimerase/fuculose-1-phosphate aldolase
MLEKLRHELRMAALEMMKLGLVEGTDGNVSVRDPETGYIAITPSGMLYEKIDDDDVMLIDVDQKIIWGTNKPSSEAPMHTYVMKHRPEVNAVMHTHSHYASLFAIANRDIPPATMNLAAQFAGPVRCTPYTRPGSDDMGPNNLKYMGENGHAVLIGNHGTLCVAPTLAKVLQYAKILEDHAKMIYEASALGAPVPLPQPEIDWIHELVKSFENPKIG